ncbi:DNA repair protein RecO, partial [Candidatus Peregrinibacteria bacterium]|nr:DNA repair protein RecO [Candidatus Peregrinibacteria bacterium]
MLSIVLSRRDFREFDQIISCYTKEKGKAELLARGVKKITSKNSAHLEPFSFVDIEIAPGKGIDHLTKVQPINYFVNIRQDLQKSLSAGYVVSFLDKILHVGEKDERIFFLTLGWLENLNLQLTTYNLWLTDGFIVKLLNCLGYDITQVSG